MYTEPLETPQDAFAEHFLGIRCSFLLYYMLIKTPSFRRYENSLKIGFRKGVALPNTAW